MYKLLLCRRYLRTRMIALASIISVMLGVATMVVVNAVMDGFSGEMKDRIHGMLADVQLEARSSDGFEDPERLIRLAREAAGDDIVAITPTVEIYGMASYDVAGQMYHQPITIVGIDPQGKDDVSPISQYLMSRTATEEMQFDPPLHMFAPDAKLDWELSEGAAIERRNWIDLRNYRSRAYADASIETAAYEQPAMTPIDAAETQKTPTARETFLQTASLDAPVGSSVDTAEPAFDDADPFAESASVVADDAGFDATPFFEPALDAPIDPYAPEPARLYVGAGLVSYPQKNPQTGDMETVSFVRPGQDITINTIKAGTPDTIRFQATVVDLFRSGMVEYDRSFVFCNLEQLQIARGMAVKPPPGETLDWADGSVTSLQIRLRDGANSAAVVERLRAMLFEETTANADGYPRSLYTVMDVSTWEDKQGALLEAVAIESAVLNVLLSLIVTVAGFGILAIFFMIVVEKTKDIGTLKALGASAHGVMSVFLGYGLSLGLVGAGCGVVLGLLFVRYINEIEDGLSWLTGQEVFNAEVYFFREIPTAVHPPMVAAVACGAVLIAVLASVLPAMRAARMHPVEALRFQ